MKTHNLKLNINFCDDVMTGVKTFEIRKNDRNFKVGDHIRFVPIKGCSVSTKHLISEKEYEITYIINGWGLKKGYVALAINEVKTVM